MPKRTSIRLTKKAIDASLPDTILRDNEVPGFGLRTTSAGSKSFIYQFRTRTGEQGRIAIGRYPAMTVDEARRLAREYRAHVDRGGNPSRDRKALRAAPNLNDLASFYCEEYAPQRGLKARTVSDARRLLTRYALPKLGTRKVKDLTVGDMRRTIADARDGSGKYEANRLRAVLSRMFTLAIQNEWRADNPCRGIERYEEDQRWRYLSEEQVGALLQACDRYSDQNAANIVRLLLFTGARLQEVIKAEWSQLDLVRGVWEKPSQHTKTKRLHRLHLPSAALLLLQEMRAASPDARFLFPGRSGDRPRADLNRPWKAITKEAGLTGFRRHDLRRTTASFMLSGGSDLATVGKALGHTQASTTARYAQLFEEVQREGISRAAERMLAARRAA